MKKVHGIKITQYIQSNSLRFEMIQLKFYENFDFGDCDDWICKEKMEFSLEICYLFSFVVAFGLICV